MSIVNKRSGEIGNITYMMFFMRIPGSDYVDAVAVIHDGDVDPSWAWTLWTLTADADEIDAMAADLESDDPQYDTQGYSETFAELEEVLDVIADNEYEDFDEMEEDLFSFFEI